MKPPELLEFLQLMRTRYASRRGLDEMRLRKLRETVRHAFENVPYYRRRFLEADVNPEKVVSLDDLRRLPVSNKADLRVAGAERLEEGFERIEGLARRHTSGYSGEPFEVYLSPHEVQRRRLREFRALIQAGFLPWDRLAALGPERPRPWRLHHRAGLYRMEFISSALPREQQADLLRTARPSVLWAYPTVLWGLFDLVGRELHKLIKPRLLLTSAQVFREPWREALLAELGCAHGQLYGAMEVGRIAAACAAHSGLHVEEDALILEILEDGRPAPPGVAGRAVVTSLDQRTMPLIRYDIGDLAAIRDGPCSCGRTTTLIEPPAGRDADLVLLPSGRRLSAAALDVALRAEHDIRQYRFTQTSRSKIVLEICFHDPPETERLTGLRRKLEALVPEPVEFEVRPTAEITGSATKFKCFVSAL